MSDQILLLGLITFMTLFMLMFVTAGIKILGAWERAAVLRLGKFYGIRGPGIIWVMPILDKIVARVSLRIQQTNIDTGKYVSSDGSTNRLTGYVSWRIVDVEKAILSLENYRESIFNVANHQVEKIAKSFPGNTVLMDEETLYCEIQQELEPIFQDWGIKLIEVNLKS